MTTEEAFVKVLQMHGIENAFGNKSDTGINAEPIIPNAFSIPCICKLLKTPLLWSFLPFIIPL